jgi:hypothetical protein
MPARHVRPMNSAPATTSPGPESPNLTKGGGLRLIEGPLQRPYAIRSSAALRESVPVRASPAPIGYHMIEVLGAPELHPGARAGAGSAGSATPSSATRPDDCAPHRAWSIIRAQLLSGVPRIDPALAHTADTIGVRRKATRPSRPKTRRRRGARRAASARTTGDTVLTAAARPEPRPSRRAEPGESAGRFWWRGGAIGCAGPPPASPSREREAVTALGSRPRRVARRGVLSSRPNGSENARDKDRREVRPRYVTQTCPGATQTGRIVVRRESMLVCFASFALWSFPIALAFRAGASPYRWTATGAAFGIVVSPASFGTYCVGMNLAWMLVGVPLTLVGLPLAMFHSSPGFQMAATAGLRSSGVVDGLDRVTIEVMNAGLWSVTYGFLGFLIDLVRQRGHSMQSNARPNEPLQPPRRTTPRG